MASFHAKLNFKLSQRPQPPPRHFTLKDHSIYAKTLLTYKYCQKPRHSINQCYKLHGFLPNFKFTKNWKFGTAANVESTSYQNSVYTISKPSSSDQGCLVPSLTKGQSSQLFMFPQQCNLADSNASPYSDLIGSTNLVGSSSYLPNFNGISYSTCILTSVARSIWIVDSRATNHMTFDKILLSNITPLSVPYLVTLPNGYRVKVTSTGSLSLSSTFTLQRVLYIPIFKYNLISVHKLMQQFNSFDLFTTFSCLV